MRVAMIYILILSFMSQTSLPCSANNNLIHSMNKNRRIKALYYKFSTKLNEDKEKKVNNLELDKLFSSEHNLLIQVLISLYIFSIYVGIKTFSFPEKIQSILKTNIVLCSLIANLLENFHRISFSDNYDVLNFTNNTANSLSPHFSQIVNDENSQIIAYCFLFLLANKNNNNSNLSINSIVFRDFPFVLRIIVLIYFSLYKKSKFESKFLRGIYGEPNGRQNNSLSEIEHVDKLDFITELIVLVFDLYQIIKLLNHFLNDKASKSFDIIDLVRYIFSFLTIIVYAKVNSNSIFSQISSLLKYKNGILFI